MKKIIAFWMKILAYAAGYLFFPFSFLFPRSRKVWVFGSFRGAFNQNAKYLFIYVSEQVPEICAVWISYKSAVVREIRSKGLKAYSFFSLPGLYYTLRGKYYFFNDYSSDICYFTSGGTVKVNLWHGVGLKKIEFCIENGPLADRYVRKTFRERYFYPFVYQRPDYFLSSTDFQSVKFAQAFRIPLEKCLNLGYPRNDVLLWDEERRKNFIDRYEPLVTRELIDRIHRYKKVYLYMPTWRDSQKELFSAHLDMEKLDRFMQETDSLFLFKPHPIMKIDPGVFGQNSHLMLLDSHVDIYTLLPYTHVLITDYSSILYDYLLMKDKDAVLYLYDYKEYVRERDFNYPFLENVAGAVVYDFGALLQVMREGEYDRSKYACITERFWGDYRGKAAAGIVNVLTGREHDDKDVAQTK